MLYNLHQLARDGDLDQVPNRLLTLETMLARDKQGNTPLHWAAWCGHLDQVPIFLLTKEIMLVKDKQGNTPLHWAAKNGNLNQMPKELIMLETMLAKDCHGITPLFYATINGYLDPLLGIDFEESAEVKETVGEEWWMKHEVVLRQKHALKIHAVAPTIDLF